MLKREERREVRALLWLGLPVVAGQLGVTLQGMVDTLMLGWWSTRSLAAAGFVNAFFTLLAVVASGFCAGVIPLSGAAHGRGDRRKSVAVLRCALVASGALSLLFMLILSGIFLFGLGPLGQPRELWGEMRDYLWCTLPSLLLLSWAGCFKSFFDSVGVTRAAVVAVVVGNVWNVAANWALIFGHLGLPALGVRGAGLATTSSRLMIFAVYLWLFFLSPRFRAWRTQWRAARPSREGVRGLCRLGVPIAVQSGFEVGSFSLCSIFVGWMGSQALAAHQVMITLTTAIWMVYFGLATAAGVRVSHFTGQGDMKALLLSARCALRLILFCAAVLTVVFLLCHREVFSLFTDDAALITLLSTLLLPTVLYQFSDALQTTFLGVLRGMGRVKGLMRDAFIAYVLVALPVSWLLGIVLEWGLTGVWMSFPISLSVAAVLYLRRVRRVLPRAAEGR